MACRVGEQRRQLGVLQKRAGPTMGEHERQRSGAHARGLDEMDRQAVELDAAVLHAVKPRLEPGGLVSLPVGEQLGQPRVRDTVLPIVAEPRAHMSVSKPNPQTVER
jgi:hypothetical protein